MATAKLSDLVSRLERHLPAPAEADTPDADLLARFLAARDEQAFAIIVRRHGPTVFGVCRRVTGDHHLAEDAFQAVFVVLAAKAASVRPRSALAAWLYGVAYRTALRARTMSDRRRRHLARSQETGDRGQNSDSSLSPDSCLLATELAAILDEEIARLPEHLRLAVVLCELEGHARKDAAARLGVPEGTLSSRLAAARKALAARLRKRGVALSAAGLSAALGQLASAGVPANLAERAVAAALTPGALPAPVAALSHGVLRVMFAQKLKTVSAALALTAVLFGGWLLAAQLPAPTAPPAGTERLVSGERVAADGQAEALRELEAVKWHLAQVLPEQRTLHVTDNPAERYWESEPDVAPDRPRRNNPWEVIGAGVSQLTLHNLPVADDAAITLDGKKVELKDLRSRLNVSLKFAADKPVVTAIEATTPPRAGYAIKEVDAEKNTIVVTRGKDGKPLTLAVQPTAYDRGTLKDLKPGMYVHLYLTIKNGELVVYAIRR
jgi:RNA polymerase sigma factor (sigma-70 family)